MGGVVDRIFKQTILGVILAAACSSSPDEVPPETPPPAMPVDPKPETPPEPPPKRPGMAVPDIRSVETARVPKQLVLDVSRKLRDQLGMGGMLQILEIGQEEGCVVEACQLSAAQKTGASHLFHTRLVQYAESCVLLGVLYAAADGKSEWASTQAFPCDEAGVEQAVSSLATKFARRSAPPPAGPVHAVAPIQHKLKDLAWASESWAEYLTTLLAESGKTVIAASVIASNLGDEAEPYQACPDKKCAVGIAGDAEGIVLGKIAQKRKTCTFTADLITVATKTSSASAKATGGCEASDIADAIRKIGAGLTKTVQKEEVPPEEPEEESVPE